jgi:serine/threonine-protein kinase
MLSPAGASAASGRGPDVYTAGTLLAGRYRTVGLLGKGGMGEVYRADDLVLGQAVALKFLPREVEGDPTRLARLLDEVRAARVVSHANVCRVYDVGEADGRHFLSMEYIDGEDLASSIRRIGRFPPDKGLEIARQLCAGLAAVHERGLLHRDLKPANVMLDGRGKVRLTDFGLAGEFEGQAAGEIVGTPAYMAPEQLAGGPASVQSDIYALGLVLYEVFAGRRAFEGATIADQRRPQQQALLPPLASSSSGIDPAIDEVIVQCLAPDPSRRPASAIAVAAALPGGDPLAAALAAGETPSPAMVAAAGDRGGLAPRVASAILAGVFVLLAVALALVAVLGFTNFASLDYPPDVLANKAQEMIARFGYTDAPRDTARGLVWNREYVQWAETHSKERGRWDAMKQGREAGILFWYRTSPRLMMAQTFFASGIASGRVVEDDPPFLLVGQQRVWLSAKGLLLRFEAIPPEFEPPAAQAPPVDWRPLFEAARLDPAWFAPADPSWAPLAWGDTRVAWTGKAPDAPGDPYRVEAAAWRGRPISFRIIRPWNRPERQSPLQQNQNPLNEALGLSLIGLLVVGAVLLARRNILLERSDRRGAGRLAWFVFLFAIAGWALEADHLPAVAEALIFVMAVAAALFLAGVVWMLYVALEPYVRRRWPHTVITWNRLLAGRLRDPLVGRDLLFGVAYGMLQAVLTWSGIGLVHRFGGVEPVPVMPVLDPLLGTRYVVSAGFSLLYSSILSALAFFVLLFLLRIILRKEWLAAVAFLAIVAVAGTVGREVPWVEGPLALVAAVLAAGVLLRLGLVAYMVGSCVVFLLTSGFPLSVDPSRWYTGPSVMVVVGLVAVAVYGYHLATMATRAAARESIR